MSNPDKHAAGSVPAADWYNQEGGRAMHKSMLRKLEKISFLFLIVLFVAALSPAQDAGGLA